MCSWFQRAEVRDCIYHYCIHLQSLGHGDFVFGGGSHEHARYALSSVVGDLSGYNAVRQGVTCLGERTHRRHFAVTLTVTCYGRVVVGAQFHGVVLVGEGGQRRVHQHLRHEDSTYAVAAQGARDSKIGEAVLVLGDGPLEAYAVVGLSFGSGKRGDDRLAVVR